MTPATYHATHSRTLPPPDQGSEENFLLLNSVVCTCLCIIIHPSPHRDLIAAHGHFQLQLKPKRAASGNLLPEHGCKQPRVST
ncbi:putative DET1- and DDB1-associated protein 1 [Sesbania bispinosa]|nr:putative DET1- and DDB1-associated protein 1 [Sesbania bispinosa]